MKRSDCQLALLVAALVYCFAAVPADAQRRHNERWRDTPNRYWAQLANGEIVIGRDLREWHHEKGRPRLDGKDLFNDNNPLRLLRDTTSQPNRFGSFVEFHNGDILPGRVISAEAADSEKGLPLHLSVAVTEPLMAFDGSPDVAIRPDAVSRIVIKGHGTGPLVPGTIIFDDGRRVPIKAVRWARGGLRALTEDGFVAAGWLEISEVHMPRDSEDTLRALYDDLAMPCPDPQSRVGRITTEHGGVFTYRKAMVKIDDKRNKVFGQYHAFQPAWSFEAIRVPIDYISTRSYRNHDQIPLSSLAAETLAQRSYTGFKWQWQRDRNVRKGELACQDMIADLGIGMHAHSEVAFELPDGAKQFSSWVGIDNAVGSGGCVRCLVYLDKVEGKPAWQSDIIRGGSDPVRVGPIDLKDAKRLILVADYAHDKRPRGSDPLDIRDEVSWLFPMVHVDVGTLPSSPRFDDLDSAMPQLVGWRLNEAYRDKVEFQTYFFKEYGRWGLSMFREGNVQHKKEDVLVAMERELTVDEEHAFLEVNAGRGENNLEGHIVSVLVDGEPLGSFLNGDVRTNRSAGSMDTRRYPLGAFLGKKIKLTLRVHPYRDGKYQPASLLWGGVQVLPIVTNLPDSGKLLRPDVSITSLKPAELSIQPKDKRDGKELQAGKTTAGEPLHIRGFPISDGYALPAGKSEITYQLDPSWKRFVAVIGMCDGTYAVGPYEVKVDDEVIWRSNIAGRTKENEGTFGRASQGEQVEIELPPDGKTITLRVAPGSRSFAVWGYAGFMKE